MTSTRIGIAKTIALVVPMFFFVSISAQNKVTIEGQGYDKDSKLPLVQLMVVNKRTGNGIVADEEGRFKLNILKTDTLTLSAMGFKIKRICFKDSIPKDVYKITIPLERLTFTLKEVSVFPIRSLNEIQRDIDDLGVRPTYSAEGVDAFQSPITYLYERFSRFGKSKRLVAELENEDLKRDILKELFRLYIKYDIINLQDEEFDAFIRYLNFSDEFMQNATQLELVLAIKGKYESFKYRWK